MRLLVGEGSANAGFTPLAWTTTPAPRAEAGLALTGGALCGKRVLIAVFDAFPPISSIISVSNSFKLDFQHITIESAPEVVK